MFFCKFGFYISILEISLRLLRYIFNKELIICCFELVPIAAAEGVEGADAVVHGVAGHAVLLVQRRELLDILWAQIFWLVGIEYPPNCESEV